MNNPCICIFICIISLFFKVMKKSYLVLKDRNYLINHYISYRYYFSLFINLLLIIHISIKIIQDVNKTHTFIL